MVGVDPWILDRSDDSSRRKFYMIGLIYIINSALIVFSVFGMIQGLFEMNWFITLAGTIVLGFIFINIYRLIMISLEPSSTDKNLRWYSPSVLLRFTFVILIATYISKSAETFFFTSVIDLVSDSSEIQNISKSFIGEMIELNEQHKWVHLFTVGINALFIAPVFLRLLARRENQYYFIKSKIDRNKIIKSYNSFIKEKGKLLKLSYEAYRKEFLKDQLSNFIESNYSSFTNEKEEIIQLALQSYPKSMRNYEFKEHISKYQDEPFRTKLKDLDKKPKTSAEFMDLPNWWIKD